MLFEYLREPELGDLFPSQAAFKYLERGMKFVGWISPPKGTRYYWTYRAWSIFMITSGAIYTQLGFFASYILDFHSFTPGVFLTSIQAAFDSCIVTLKVSIVLPNTWRFKKAMDQLDLMDNRCTQGQERIQIHRCVARCNRVFLIYTAVYCFFSTSTYLSSVLTGSTPWGLYIPGMDYRSSTRSLWIVATFEYVVGSAAVYLAQMADIYPVIFGIILRTHIQLLKQRVERLRTTRGETGDQSNEQLVNCIKDQKLILQYCNIFRPIISGTIFFQFLAIGLCLGMSMLNLFFFSTLWSGMATVAFITLVMFQTFPFCYICELIAEDCDNLALAIFHSNWIDASKRYKTNLIYFLHQAQLPINFTAGGIFPICMKTNIEMAKLAFSVITVAQQMNFIDKLK